MSEPQTSLAHIVTGHDGEDLEKLLTTGRSGFRRLLHTNGAVLFRGFAVGGVDGLQRVVKALSGQTLAYTEKSSPRSVIAGNVYTSTDHPATEDIFLHNESSYQVSWPMTLYFHCVEPAESFGATSLADSRRVQAGIDPDVRDEFARRRWMLVRNYHDRFGLSWQETFGTGDRHEVESYCVARGLSLEWQGDRLRTRAVREAIHQHPATGETVWFNHITFFHHTTLSEDVAEGLLALFGEDRLPANTYYGDGGRIPDDVMDHLRDCYRSETTRFDWERDDLLVVDNMLASHGRERFTGPRRIAVAMAEASSPPS
jgi:alpha-ketoglutarate-dependent taurine dioxygenase